MEFLSFGVFLCFVHLFVWVCSVVVLFSFGYIFCQVVLSPSRVGYDPGRQRDIPRQQEFQVNLGSAQLSQLTALVTKEMPDCPSPLHL